MNSGAEGPAKGTHIAASTSLDSLPHGAMVNAGLRRTILSMVKSICGSQRYEYVSGPITGGIRLVELALASHAAEPLGNDQIVSEVLKPNLSAIMTMADRIRRDEGVLLIEPASFEADVEGWGQADFLALWDEVIEKYTSRVRFIDGWQYSSGCAFEFHSAVFHGVKMVDMAGRPLTMLQAIMLLDQAIDQIDSYRTGSISTLTELGLKLRVQRDRISGFSK